MNVLKTDELKPLLRSLLINKKGQPYKTLDFRADVLLQYLEDNYYQELSFNTKKSYHQIRADVYRECRDVLAFLMSNEDRWSE